MANVTLANLYAVSRVVEPESEDLVTLFSFRQLLVQDLYNDFLFSLVVIEFEYSLLILEIDAGTGSPLALVDLNSFVTNGDFAIGVVDSLDDDGALVVGGRMAHVRVGKGELAWLVVVQDSDAALRVAPSQSRARVQVVKLDQEVLIGFPAMVVNNGDLDSGFFFSVLEFNLLVQFREVLTGSGRVVDGAHTDATNGLVLVRDRHFGMYDAFGDRHMEASKSVIGMLDSLIEIGGHVVLLTVLLSLLDDGFGPADCHHLAVLSALHERLALQNSLELLKVDVLDT